MSRYNMCSLTFIDGQIHNKSIKTKTHTHTPIRENYLRYLNHLFHSHRNIVCNKIR